MNVFAGTNHPNAIRLKVLGIIPARYASTRFPGKPLVMLQDKSMIERVYHRASQAFETVVAATDDKRIADEVQRFGGRVVMTSPLHRSGTDRCAEALALIDNDSAEKADVVVNIQGDEPFVDPALLVRLADCFEDASVQIATVVKAVDNTTDLFDPNCVKAVMTSEGRAVYFSRSPIPYVRGYAPEEWLQRYTFYKHLGLYAYRADTLRQLAQLPPSPPELAESLEQNRWLENGYYIKIIQSDRETIAIDTPEDLEKARKWLENNKTPL